MHFIGKSIKSNYNFKSKELIIKSLGIICHTGAPGLEAEILQKPPLLFGNPVYNQDIEHTQNIAFRNSRIF